MSNFLAPIVQSQIEKTIGDRFRDLELLERRIGMVSRNNDAALGAIYDHERLDFNAHGIKEAILDVINENLLTNAGLELDEDVPGMPDGWTVVSEISSSDYSVALNNDYFKYGERSLKIAAVNNLSVSRRVYIQQEVEDSILGGAFYTIGFYCVDNESDEFSYFARVDAYDESNVLVDSVHVDFGNNADIEGIGSFSRALRRVHEVFNMPEGASYCKVSIGIDIEPNTSAPVEVWIDYPTFHLGFSPLQPNELTEGILKTKHISTEGLDAKVIKVGDIEITERLSLRTESGDIWLRRDEINDGNVLEFFRDESRIITLGKYGPDAGDYGLEIVSGDDSLRANAFGIEMSGRIKAKAGEIAGFIIEDNSIKSTDGEIELDSSLKRITIRDGESPVFVAGEYESGKYGVNILSGRIALGGVFEVDEDGRLTSTSGNIGGVEIESNKLSFPDDSIVLDAANKKIVVSDGTKESVVIGQFAANKFGIDIKYGQINLGDGKFQVNSEGKLISTSGIIGGVTIGDNKLSFPDNIITLDAQNKRITVSDGAKDVVYIGEYDTNKFGVSIKHGQINLGDGKFEVDDAGSLTATSGVIGGVTIDSNKLSFPDNRIILDAQNRRIIVSDGDNDVAVIGEYEHNKFGVYIEHGLINLGNGKFEVDEDGKLTSTSGNIGGVEIESDRLVFPDENIVLDSLSRRIIVSNDGKDFVVIGKYHDDSDEFGIRINYGDINLGNGKFVATSSGEITAIEGTIGNFKMSSLDRRLRSVDDSVILDGESSEIILSNSPSYATVFAPGAIYGRLPIARLSSFNFKYDESSPAYYVEIDSVKSGSTEYVRDVDYLFNQLTGELVRKKGSPMPDDVTVHYTIYDSRLQGQFMPLLDTEESIDDEYDIDDAHQFDTDDDVSNLFSHVFGINTEDTEIEMVERKVVEEVRFQVIQRATAIITDDALLDAKFVRNLFVGSADIGHAVINTAHVNSLHGKVIEVDTLHGNRIIAKTLDISQLNFVPLLSSGNDPTDIIGTINATDDAGGTIHIDARLIKISGETVFETGFDPRERTTTFYQDEPPTEGMKVGDIWVDTDDANTIYFWTGSDWEIGGTHGDFLEKDVYLIDGTYINGATISTGSITLNHLDFAAVTKENVIASINASTEDGGTLRIEGNRIVISGETTFEVGDYSDTPFLDRDTFAFGPNKTTIDGGKIQTDTITLSHLNFTVAHDENIIAIINASEEKDGVAALRIKGEKIIITGETVFESGDDYSDTPFLDRGTYLFAGKTTIDGGNIEAETITLGHLNFQAAEADKIIATINLSDEQDGGKALRIKGEKVIISGETVFEAADYSDSPFLDKDSYLATGKTTIDGGNIETETITLSHLNFVAVHKDNVIARINLSDEMDDGKALRISGEKIVISGETIFESGNYSEGTPFLDRDTYLAGPGKTTIDGGKIETETITLNHLNFVPVEKSSVIGTINASSEGIRIEGKIIEITGETVFKLEDDYSSGTPFLDRDTFLSTSTTIDGGKIETGTIKAAQLDVEDAVLTTSTQIKGGIITTIHVSTEGLDAGVIKTGELEVGGDVTIKGEIEVGSDLIVKGEIEVGGDLVVKGEIDGDVATLKNLNAGEIKAGTMIMDTQSGTKPEIKLLGNAGRIEIKDTGIVAHGHRTNNSPQAGFDMAGFLFMAGGRIRGDATGLFGYDSTSGGDPQAGFNADGKWIAGGGLIEADASGFRAGDLFKIDVDEQAVSVTGKLVATQLFLPVSS